MRSSLTRSGGDYTTETPTGTIMAGHSVAMDSTSSPARTPYQNPATASASSPSVQRHSGSNADALSRLPPAQAREMREAFQILDRDNDGLVDREDVSETLVSLGKQARLSLSFPLGHCGFCGLTSLLLFC